MVSTDYNGVAARTQGFDFTSPPSPSQPLANHPTAKISVGSTELTIEVKFKNAFYPVTISPQAVPELNKVKVILHSSLA